MVYDQSYQLNKNEFTLDGYEFKGWATSPNGQVVYKDEEIVTKLTDKSNINPQTGDVASVGLLQSIIVGSTSILALLLGNRNKRKR